MGGSGPKRPTGPTRLFGLTLIGELRTKNSFVTFVSFVAFSTDDWQANFTKRCSVVGVEVGAACECRYQGFGGGCGGEEVVAVGGLGEAYVALQCGGG